VDCTTGKAAKPHRKGLEDEYQETFDKAAAMLKLLQQSAASQTGA
jgi:hypothetical protein